MSLAAGDLRERVTRLIHARVDPDPDEDFGRKVDTWTDGGTFSAMVEVKTDGESLSEQQVQSTTHITVTLRLNSQTKLIVSNDKLRWLGEEYDIGSVNTPRDTRDRVIVEASRVT